MHSILYNGSLTPSHARYASALCGADLNVPFHAEHVIVAEEFLVSPPLEFSPSHVGFILMIETIEFLERIG